MRIGVSVATDIRNSDLGVYAEKLGFDTFWGTDSQMIWSDVYSYLALVASKTTRISIGPLVAVAPTRLAPVTAQSIATINRLAPGRTILAVGTAHTAMKTMGMKPMPARQFGEYLRVVRALLHDEEVEYELNGTSNPIQFMHRSLELIALYPTIPIYVSAMGPRTQRLAGQYGDGVVSGNPSLESVRQNLAEGAARSGRVLPVGFPLVKMGAVAVVMPGEAIDSDFVVDCVGPRSWAVSTRRGTTTPTIPRRSFRRPTWSRSGAIFAERGGSRRTSKFPIPRRPRGTRNLRHEPGATAPHRGSDSTQCRRRRARRDHRACPADPNVGRDRLHLAPRLSERTRTHGSVHPTCRDARSEMV